MNTRFVTFVSMSLLLSASAAGVAPKPGVRTGLPSAGDPISGANRVGRTLMKIGERNPLKPPFIEVFDDFPSGSEHAEFERRFQVIDSNNDNRSWGFYNYSDEFYSKCAYLLYPLEDGYLDGVPGRRTSDDWLIPRAIQLEGGKYYNVSVDASLYQNGTEHCFEVKMGYYNDAEGMEFDVIPPTVVNSMFRKQASGWFKAPDSGLYYMGIHAISERAKCSTGYLFIDNIAMGDPKSGLEPRNVYNVLFVNDPNGTTGLDISFNLPTESIDGNALKGTVDYVVKYGNKIVAQKSGAAPGQIVSFTHDPEVNGMVQYSFQVSNAAGTGAEYKISHYAGFVEPEPPVVTSLIELGEDKVRLTWEPSLHDLNGNAVNADVVRYNIYDYTSGSATIAEPEVEGTSIDLEVNTGLGGQSAALYLVSAILNGLESTPAASDILVVGTPYEFPYRYSFVESPLHVVTATGDQNVVWRMLDSFSNPKPQDDDNGYISMIGTTPGEVGEIATGKVDLAKATRPYVSFYTYVYDEDENEITVSIVDCETGEKSVVREVMLSALTHVGWNRIIVPITQYAGKVVRVAIQGEIQTHGYIPLDNLVIDDLRRTDLSVEMFNATPHASVGEQYEVVANVTNTGAEAVNGYVVRLMCNGKEVSSVKRSETLASMQSATTTLKGAFTSVSPEMPTFTIEVEAAGDEDESNNVSQPFTITFLVPNHPVATNLKATVLDGDNTVSLSWSAPDLSKAAPESVFEDFESYPSFTTELKGGWTMYDGDKGLVAGFNGVELPVAETQQAWWTMKSDAPYNFVPTRGSSVLAQMTTNDESGRPVVCDDWIISPELYGGRQVVSFYARSLRTDVGYETFEVYASTTDNDPTSFEIVRYESELPEEWTQFYLSLPEGTRYFAIRCTSYNVYMMLIDDVTYTPVGTPRPYTLVGYNVYRNDEKINTDVVKSTEYADKLISKDDRYFVTAVYDRGESSASNMVSVNNTGIDSPEVDSQLPVEFYDLNGRRVQGIKLLPGIYIRRQGSKVTKIAVR